jgi:ATP-dependent Clp protease adaptor protein ClpS
MQASVAFPDVKEREKDLIKVAPAQGWSVIVWNDHINTMTYVAHVFRKVLGFGKALAHRHMMEVHIQGKSCVAKESREKAELFWEQLQSYGLRCTLEKSD